LIAFRGRAPEAGGRRRSTAIRPQPSVVRERDQQAGKNAVGRRRWDRVGGASLARSHRLVAGARLSPALAPVALFNPANFCANPDNAFGDLCYLNMIGVGSDLEPAFAYPPAVTEPDDS
jgi:hypothetical protein